VDLPIEKMIALTKMLSEVDDLKIIVTGDSSEKELLIKEEASIICAIT